MSKQYQNALETLKAKGVNTKLYELEQDLQDVESGLTQLRSVVDYIKQEHVKQAIEQQFFDKDGTLLQPKKSHQEFCNEKAENGHSLHEFIKNVYDLLKKLNKENNQKVRRKLNGLLYKYLFNEKNTNQLMTDLLSLGQDSSLSSKSRDSFQSLERKINGLPFVDPFGVGIGKSLTTALELEQNLRGLQEQFNKLKRKFNELQASIKNNSVYAISKEPLQLFLNSYESLLNSKEKDRQCGNLKSNDLERLQPSLAYLQESIARFSENANPSSFVGEASIQEINKAEQQQALQELLYSSLNTETDQSTFNAIQNYIKATGAELEPKERLLVSIKNLQCQCQSKTQLKQLCDSVLQNPENIDAQTLLKVACHKGTDKQSFDAIQTYLDNAKPSHTQQLFLNIKQLQLSAQNNNEVKQICGSILQYATEKQVERNAKFYELLSRLSFQIAPDTQLQAGKEAQSSIEKEFLAPIYSYLHRGGDVSESVKALVANVSAGFLSEKGERYKKQKPSNNDAHDRLKKILEIKRKNLTDQDQQELAIIDRYLKPEEPKSDGMSRSEELEVVQGPENPNANDPVKNNGSSLKDNKTSYGRGSRKNGESILNDGSARSDPSSGSATTASTGEEASEGNGSGLNFSSGHPSHASQERRNSAIQKNDDNGAEQSLENLTDELLKFHPGQDGKSPILNEGGQVIDYNALANLNRIHDLLLKIDKSERDITSLDSQKRSEFKRSVNYIRDEVNAFKPYKDQVYNYNGQLKTESDIQSVIVDKINNAKTPPDDFVKNLKQMLDITEEKSIEDIRSNSQQYADQLIKKLKKSPKQTYLLDEKHAGLFWANSSRKTDEVRIYAQNPKEVHQFYSYEKNNQIFFRQFPVQQDNQHTDNLIQQIKDNADRICKKVDPPVFDIIEASKSALSEYKQKMREKFPQEKKYAENNDGTRATMWVKRHPDPEEVANRLRRKNDPVLQELEHASEYADNTNDVKKIISLLYGSLGRERNNNESPIAQARAKFVENLCENFYQYCQLNNKDYSNDALEKEGSQEDKAQTCLKQLLKDQYASEQNQSDKASLIDNVLNVVQRSLGAKGQKSGKYPGSHDRKMTNVAQKFIDLLQSSNTDNLKQSIQNALKAKLNKNDDMFEKQGEKVKTFVNAVTESRHSCASLCFWKTKEEYQLTATGADLYEAMQDSNSRPQA